jgi:hypothetical protein
MKLVAHQAVYGEVNGAHALVAKSSDARSPFLELTSHSDRPPGLLPPNVVWEPYVSGHPLGDYYILSITFPDETASRPGMVITHALIFKTTEFAILDDLSLALQLLPAVPHRPSSIGPVDIVVPDETLQSADRPGLGNVIRLLLDEQRGDKPVVWIGQEGFNEIIVALWRGLWSSARSTFRFRLSFTPQDAEGQDLTIVATPAQMENRWSGYPMARLSDVHEPNTKAEALLMGRAEGERLRALFQELEAEPQGFGDLRKGEACCEYLESLRAGSINANGARMLVRLLGTLSKGAHQGVGLKALALDGLLKLSRRGTAADIQGLKNLDVAPFRSGSRGLKETVAEWFAQHGLAEDKQTAEEIAALVTMSFSSGPSVWRSAMQDSLRSGFRTWRAGAATAIWHWWLTSPSLITGLDELIPNSKRVETDLAERCPQILPQEMGENISIFAQKRGWMVLHAMAVIAYSAPSGAFQTQLNVDTDVDHFDGLRAIAERVPSTALIDVALDTGEIRLLQIAGEACAIKSELLADFDTKSPRWRNIWLYSMRAGAEPWAGIVSPRRVMDELIDLLIDGTAIEVELIDALATTTYADLGFHPRRGSAWQYIDQSARERFVDATADGWLQRFKVDSNLDDGGIETELESAIVSASRIAKHLTMAGTAAASLLVSLFRRFSRLTSQHFRDQLTLILGTDQLVNAFDAILIGKIITDKRWYECAGTLAWYVLERNRLDILPALQECQTLLGWVDTFRLRFSGKMRDIRITTDDWWSALLETAVELYEYGPEHLWEHAGGEPGVINWKQSGQTQWKDAIRLLRKGGGGKGINPSKLLKAMRKEYGQNRKLELLYRWHEEHR